MGWLAPIKGLLDAAPHAALHADSLIQDGDRVERDFVVLETPGHSAGHVSYFYEPDRVLFAGDALAVAGDRPVYMSRYLTLDQAAGRRSMLRCLEHDARVFCPGHRYPLVEPRAFVMTDLANHVRSGKRWPVVGC